MRKITLIAFIISFGIIGSLFAQTNHWVESFENPLDPWTSYTTGPINFQESGVWDFVSVYPEASAASWDGVKACRINDDVVGASITSPAVNSLGKVSFYYHRPFGGTGTFQLQVSLDGGAYTTLDNVNFDAVITPTYYEYDVNNVSNNIKVRIVNDDNSAHLTIDYVTLTDYSGGATPFISISPSSLSGFSYVFGSGPSASQSFTVEGTDLTADIDVAPSTNYEISLDDAIFTLSSITLTQSGGTVTSTTIYTRIQAGLAGGDYNEDITSSSTGATDKTVSCSGTVEAPATTTLPYSETFDLDLGDCYTYSVLGATKEWQYALYGSNGYADLNGYNSGDTEEDWLILPGIDFDSYSNEIMSFDTWWQYGNEDANNYLKLHYSSNYPGIGDPSSYTWTELSFTQGAENAWTSSGIIDLSAITGSAVYIAFEYQYEAGSYRHWEVDNISIVPSVPVNVTFQVNMSDEGTISGDGVHVAGSFNSWNPAATLMTDAGGGIYTVTLPLMSNVEYQFKYLNGNAWGTEESVPTGCETGGNRTEVTTSPDYSIPVVCFGSCVDCGGAYFDITFQVDMQNETVSGDVYLAGSFTDWGTSPIAMTQNGTIWSTTVSLQENSPEEYKFINGSTWEFIGNRLLTIPSANTIIDVDCFNSYDACPVSDFVIINEVDADQDGTDTQEFIELYDGGVGNTSLSGLVVVLYNGSDDQSYLPATDLDGYSTNGSGYFVIGSATVPNVDLVLSNGFLQNGADAVALYVGDDTDFPNDTPVTTTDLLDAIVYDTNDGDDNGLLVLLNPGEPQVNEGGRGSNITHSSQRLPNGSGGQRNTSTYDQAFPTPGAINAASFTDWTGLVDNNWDDAGNWTTGIPVVTLGATIPDVNPAPFPVISGSANCMSLYMAGGSSLDISPSGDLTIVGSFTNNGSLTVKSDATGTGSLIEGNGVYATVERHYTGTQWHLISSPVADAVTGMFTGLYLMNHDEPSNAYSDIVSTIDPLNPMQGYALWNQNGDATASFMGTLNTGALNAGLTRTAPGGWDYGWNLVGNPYPSSIDWLAASGWTKTNVSGTIYLYTGSTWATFSIPGSGTNGGTQYVAPGQGFFVSVNDDGSNTGSLGMTNDVRVHNATTFFKDEVIDLVKLQVANGELSDETVIMFNENATVGFDGEFDAHKLFSFNTEVPQIYSTANGFMAANVLPEISSVAIDVTANDGDVLIINAIETSEFAEVYLEDTYTGIVTDLISESYTFIYNSDVSDRFVVHFGALDIDENIQNLFTVYSANDQVVVITPENTNGEINIYNIMGQEVYSAPVNGTINTISVEKSAYYVVKVISNEQITSTKVFIK